MSSPDLQIYQAAIAIFKQSTGTLNAAIAKLEEAPGSSAKEELAECLESFGGLVVEEVVQTLPVYNELTTEIGKLILLANTAGREELFLSRSPSSTLKQGNVPDSLNELQLAASQQLIDIPCPDNLRIKHDCCVLRQFVVEENMRRHKGAYFAYASLSVLSGHYGIGSKIAAYEKEIKERMAAPLAAPSSFPVAQAIASLVPRMKDLVGNIKKLRSLLHDEKDQELLKKVSDVVSVWAQHVSG